MVIYLIYPTTIKKLNLNLKKIKNKKSPIKIQNLIKLNRKKTLIKIIAKKTLVEIPRNKTKSFQQKIMVKKPQL